MARRQTVERTTLADLAPVLPRPPRSKRGRPVVVVLADRPADAVGLRIRSSGWTKAHVVRMVAATDGQTHDQLATLRRLDLVVDLRRSDDGRQLETFRRCFFHLDADGAWVAVRLAGALAGTEPLVDLAAELEAGVAHDHWAAHLKGARRIRVHPAAVVVRARARHLLRVSEDALPLLAQREPSLGVTTLATLPGGSIEVGHLMHDHGATPEPRVPDVLHYPEHTVRHYEGRLKLPRSTVVHHRRTLLPDSFRWHLTPEPDAPGLSTVDEHFSRLRLKEQGSRLDGSYFFFAYANTGHFGHLMTEALSKLWGWWPAKEADPSLRLLCRLHPTRGDTADERLENVLLPPLGISPDDIVWVDGAVEVESLVGCTPMWHNASPFYFHPAIRDTWDRLRIGILGQDQPTGPSKVFITRHVGGRPCRNIEEVEEIFAAHGFAVVSPERLSIPEQAALFANADVVAGLGGSGMFNLVYAQRVHTVIVLNHWAYQARNEHLFAAAHEAQLHCFWSEPDADHPEGAFSYAAHQGSWSFDMATNGPPLTELLTGLPG